MTSIAGKTVVSSNKPIELIGVGNELNRLILVLWSLWSMEEPAGKMWHPSDCLLDGKKVTRYNCPKIYRRGWP